MPPLQRGSAYKLKSGKGWGLRYYDSAGKRRRRSPFKSRSDALKYFQDVVEPELRGEPKALPDITLSELVPLYLERHSASVRPKTVATLRERLRYATEAFGDIRLRELERMSGEIASWQGRLSERSRFGIVSALRQTLGAAVRWGYIDTNPAVAAGRNRQPAPRAIRVFTRQELEAISAELDPRYAPIPLFAASTGLRPEEWIALERRDVDRNARILTVRRTVSDGAIVELGKTDGSRRQVPLSRRALKALEAVPARLDTPLVFPAPMGGPINLDNWRRRVWTPAIEACGVRTPARIYDLRATFISEALHAGVPVFTVARIAGTSVKMIERSYGTLVDGAMDDIAGRLDALDDRATDQAAKTSGP